VCGSVRAWRFGLTNPALLTPEDDAFRDGLDGECLLFWNVLGQGGPPSAPLAGVAPGRRRVHVLPASSAVDDLFPALDAVLAHPGTFLSVHISEKERGTPPKRLPKELGAKAVVTVLDSADRELVLPVAWTQQRTAKGAGTHLLERLFVGMVRHGPVTDKEVVAAMGAQLRAFLQRLRSSMAAPRSSACHLGCARSCGASTGSTGRGCLRGWLALAFCPKAGH